MVGKGGIKKKLRNCLIYLEGFLISAGRIMATEELMKGRSLYIIS
jgi:hypothetical protein